MLDEPGIVFYVCVNRTLDPPTPEEVFAQSGPGGSEPELSGRIEVTAAFTLFSDGQCNASPTASGCDVWAVAEDMQPPPDGETPPTKKGKKKAFMFHAFGFCMEPGTAAPAILRSATFSSFRAKPLARG